MIYWSKRFRVKISKMIPCSHELGQIHWPLERRLKSSQPYKWRSSIANYSLIKKSIIHDFNLWFMWVDHSWSMLFPISASINPPKIPPIEPTKTKCWDSSQGCESQGLGWRSVEDTQGLAKLIQAMVISRNPQASTSWTTYDWWIASKCIYVLAPYICLFWTGKYLRV